MDNYAIVNKFSADEASPIVGTAIPSDEPPKGETAYVEQEENPSNTSVVIGCGLAGCIVGGPFLALLTALGGAYAAERNQGPIGDSSRAIGRITAAAGTKAREEHLLCKMKGAILSLFGKKCESCQNQAAPNN